MMPLDKNESYWMLDDKLVGAVPAPSARELSTYPDYDELNVALAKYAGVSSENVLATPGSVTAIEYIARAYAENGGEVLLPVPTFYCYESILESVRAKTVPIPYEEKDGRFVFPLERTLTALARGSAKALFLCHPNNPLGCPLSPQDIAALAAAAKGSGTLIVSDEAYFEFSAGTSFLPHLAKLPNLLIIRTLSKAFALSGARVGYIIAAPESIKNIGNVVLPWPVAHQSVTAALALLAREADILPRRAAVMEARERFVQALLALPGVAVYPSETNFVLVRVPEASRVREALLAQDICVALGEPMSRFPESKELLKDTLRIAVPAPESETIFIHALQNALP